MASTNECWYGALFASLIVGHHSKLLTIGDCTKDKIREYYNDRLLHDVPEPLRKGLNFDQIHNYFGGKLAHWSDYLTEYANMEGKLTRISLFPLFQTIFDTSVVPQSTGFHQAYTSLRIHLSHALFPRYSPVPSHSSPSPSDATADETPNFSRPQLTALMRKLTNPPYSAEYFTLCGELGSDAVDALVKSRLVELRWTGAVSDDGYSLIEGKGEFRFERPRIVAMTPVLKKAMEVVLKEDGMLDEEEEKEKENS